MLPMMSGRKAAQSVESHLKKLAREGRVLESVVRDAPSRWLLVR